MSTKVAEGRLEVRQIYRLLQFVNEVNKPEVEKILELGVGNLIHLTEPKDWIGVLHAATLTNDLGDAVFFHRGDCKTTKNRSSCFVRATWPWQTLL